MLRQLTRNEGIIVFFTQKIVTELSKMWVGDPRSGIQKTVPGVKKAPDPGFATLVEYDCYDFTRRIKRKLCHFAAFSHTVPYHSYFQGVVLVAGDWNKT